MKVKSAFGGQKQIELLMDQFVERLTRQGYEVAQNVTLKGKSGVKRTFDLLASQNHGFITYTVAVGIITKADDPGISLHKLFAFYDKCHDCGIQHQVIIAFPWLSSVASRWVQEKGLKAFDEQGMEAFLASPPFTRQGEENVPTRFKEKAEVAEALRLLGYQVEEEAKLVGNSGTEYSFDILASWDDGFLTFRLAIDLATGKTADLDQVSLFDTKCGDTGMGEKALLVSGELTAEAEQFAEQHQIEVINLDSQVQPVEVLEEVLEEIPQPPEVSKRLSVVDQLLGGLVKTKPVVEEAVIEKPVAEEAVVEEPVVEEAVLEKPVAEEAVVEEPVVEIQPVVAEPKVKLGKASQTEALRLIPEATARRFTVIPLTITDNILEVAMVNPTDLAILQVLEHQSRMRIKPIAAEEKEIQEAIDFNYKGFGRIEQQIARIDIGTEVIAKLDLVHVTTDAPVAAALNLIIEEAVKARASDIHIEPEEKRLRIRYRIDGVLQEVMSLPSKIHPSLTSRVKIMADMNIADHLRAQDGQFSTEVRGKPIDVRVATSPTVHGETTVLRLLDKSLAVLGLSELGFSFESLAKYETMLKVPFGMILISGPTGAGKTTTLYASLNRLDKMTRNILTIEDPAEYRFDGINQIQVNPKAGVTFVSGLRSILRLDPDVIMVGEIRDGETARMAVQSALTGHLVLSSIHANDAVGVIFRLLDLGIEPFLVCSVVTGIVAQRMVRRLCPHCSIEVEAPPFEQLVYQREIGESVDKLLQGSGCELCLYSGYRGRTGIFEILVMSDEIRMLVLKGASTAQIREQAIKEGMVPLAKDGMLKVKQGITTVPEVMRNAYFIE